MNFLGNPEDGREFLGNKIERKPSDLTITSENYDQNPEIPLIVLKPSSRYAEQQYQSNNLHKNTNSKIEINNKFQISNVSNFSNSLKNTNIKSRKNSTANENKLSCNCKNSQCLKFYCECFSTLLYCDPKVCSCKNCMNNKENDTVRSEAINSYFAKSPNSFKKVISEKFPISFFDSNLSFKGCTCKKSNCLKKYCECFQAGTKCGSFCKCLDCKNSDRDFHPNKIWKHPQSKNKCTIFTILSGNEIDVKEDNLEIADELPQRETIRKHDRKLEHVTKNNNSSTKFIFTHNFKIKREIIVPYKIIIHNYRVNKEYQIDN